MPKYAVRPIFIPQKSPLGCFSEISVKFEFHSGFAQSQKQKSIQSLHSESNLDYVLEVSTKSQSSIGFELSAFNLTYKNSPIECLFQGSKCFENGGPYTDMYSLSPLQAKKDSRIKTSGSIKGFMFDEYRWPLIPKSAFYDWLYLNALALKKRYFYDKLKHYDGFSDIEFNPKKSISTQSRSCAIFVCLCVNNLLEDALQSPERFIEIVYGASPHQLSLF